MKERTFRSSLTRRTIELAPAAFCLAREIAYPELDIDAYLGRLDDLAREAGRSVSPDDPPDLQADTLAAFLFEAKGFRGNRMAYHDPRNSFLCDVLDRRLGIPITLSALYLILAEQLGIPAYGIGLPGHFVVAADGAEGRIYLDPFHGGIRLSENNCIERIRETTGYRGEMRPEWFAPVSTSTILSRMLTNLRQIYFRREQWVEARRTLRLMHHLQPTAADVMRDYGLVSLRLGHYLTAATMLERWQAQTTAEGEPGPVAQMAQPLIHAWARLN